MAFMDLSVKGKASPRHERPFSGKRSGYANRHANTKANIFGISEPTETVNTPKKTASRKQSGDGITSNANYKTPNAPRDSSAITIPSAGVISQSELEATKKLVGSSNKKKDEPKVFEVNGKLYIDNPQRPRSRKAPEGVPKLQLGVLADRDDELKNPCEDQPPNFDTPNSQTSVSWGTPINNQYYNYKQETSYQVCTENAEERFSSQRQKPNGIPDLDLQLSHSGNEQFRKALRERNKREKEQQKNNKAKVDSSEATKPWLVQPQKESEMLMKVADEKAKLRVTRKNEIIDEALVGDELTREVVRDPQAKSSSFNSPPVGPKEKRHQALFSRNPTASAKVSENLSQRLRFSTRILSKDGRDVHRELNGFYFPADDTLTVYEFRQFGSRSSALPLIQRGKYYHTKGRTRDEPYSLLDIITGNDLTFETSEQTSLPDNLKRKPYVTLRITDVDMEAKQRFAFKDTHTPVGVVSPSHELLRRTKTQEESKDKELVDEVKALVRNQLKKRGVKTITGLGRHFYSLDTTGDGTLDKDELKESLKQFNIRIPSERFDEIWSIVDANHDGALDYNEFTRNFIGEMNEKRKALVLKVFRKMDPSKRGVVPLTNLAKFYSARQHPHVLSGKVTEEEVRQQLLSTFEHCKRKGEITYAEFEDYFEGFSLTVDDDDEFVMIMRNCWAI